MDFYDPLEYAESFLDSACPECGGDEYTCTCDPYMQACEYPGTYFGCGDCYLCDELEEYDW